MAVVYLSEEMIDAAKVYFFQKATLEVKQFVDPSKKMFLETVYFVTRGVSYPLRK